MGKHKSVIWTHFTIYQSNDVTHGKCNYCPTTFRKNATRMTQHLLYKCRAVPEEAKFELREHYPHIVKRDYKMELEYFWPDRAHQPEKIQPHCPSEPHYPSEPHCSTEPHFPSEGSDGDIHIEEIQYFADDIELVVDNPDVQEMSPSSNGIPQEIRRSSPPTSSEVTAVVSTRHSWTEASAARAAIQAFGRKLSPMLDRVIVQKAEAVTRSKGGIVIPEKAQGKILEGTIIAVGPGARNDRGEHVPVGVVVGDSVLLPEYGGTKVEIDEKELFIYREHDILAKINKE